NYACTLFLFYLTATATPLIHSLSLHDALPIYHAAVVQKPGLMEAVHHIVVDEGGAAFVHHLGLLLRVEILPDMTDDAQDQDDERSEEHTSELQSRGHLVCRLLLEKKKKIKNSN